MTVMAKLQSKTTTKSRRVVRGPQLALPLKSKRAKKEKAKGGNPFFACRVPGKLLAAFKRHAKGKKTSPGALLRAYMVKVTGVKVADAD
jgi:hypothetical protein